MTTSIAYDGVAVGETLPTRSFPISRANLVRYAGASGDFNPLHWNARFAVGVGLPDVIAHGMLTMATAARLVTDWVGDPAAVLDYSVRFTRPVVVPDDEIGAELEVDGVVGEKLPDGVVRIDLTVRSAGDKVLGVARVLVRLS
jgi:acyl dehydratase